MVSPCAAQMSDILCGDLVEIRVAHTTGVVPIDRPIAWGQRGGAEGKKKSKKTS
jgi:hypothetical protein